MTSPLPFVVASAILALAASSCKEDPKLVEKREQQKIEIVRLTGELALLDEKLNSLPPDMGSQLAKAETQLAEQTDDIAELEAQITELSAKKSALQKEYDAWRAKHPVK